MKNTFLLIMFLVFATSVGASPNTGSVYLGKNLSKSLSEHTDRLYITIDNSPQIYFNTSSTEPVMENLNLDQNHIVRIFFDDQQVESWIFNFSQLNTKAIIIWRSAGAWRMEPIP